MRWVERRRASGYRLGGSDTSVCLSGFPALVRACSIKRSKRRLRLAQAPGGRLENTLLAYISVPLFCFGLFWPCVLFSSFVS